MTSRKTAITKLIKTKKIEPVKLEIVDSSGGVHNYEGDSTLKMFSEANTVRVYVFDSQDEREASTLASFTNYISAKFL